MASPHLLRPFTSRQLSLVSGDGRVMLFAVLGGRFAGPSVLVHLPTLVQRIEYLPSHIETVAFIDDPVPDGAVIGLVDDMIDTFLGLEADALSQYVAASEAVKRVTGGRVSEGIDRSSLLAVRAPEVIRRQALVAAIEGAGIDQWISPTGLVAQRGGTVRFMAAGAVFESA